MLRGMVFLDHMNFNIAVNDYYKTLGATSPKLDYGKMMRTVVTLNLFHKLHLQLIADKAGFIPRPQDPANQDPADQNDQVGN